VDRSQRGADGPDAVPVRVAARTVLVHETGLVLVQLHGGPHAVHWACPGGGVEGQESLREAARRELLEEAGRQDAPGQELWTWEHDFAFDGRPVRQRETYFLARTDDLTLPAQDPDPVDGILTRRWSSLEELDRAPEPVWPPDLTTRLADVMNPSAWADPPFARASGRSGCRIRW